MSLKPPDLDAPIPQDLPILPLRNTVVFPYVTVPLSVGRPKTVKAIEKAQQRGDYLAIISQKDGFIDHPGPEDLYTIGTVARITKVTQLHDGSYNVVVYGLKRIRLEEFIHLSPYLRGQFEILEPEPAPEESVVRAKFTELRSLITRYMNMSESFSGEVEYFIENIEDPGILADLTAYHLKADMVQKQHILERLTLMDRIETVMQYVQKEIEVQDMSNRISRELKGRFDKSQRETMLREQLKAIRKELGEVEEKDEEIIEVRRALRKARLPEQAQKSAEKELDRLARTSPMSAEYSMIRTYLDWLCEIPWSNKSEDNLDLERAARILDEDHYDLEKVKKRIIEYLAVRKLKNQLKGPILCFVGPPGVGKTSLGKSIARAMERRFVRVSLGGVRDEAEVRGHRRTYVGALPGRIIQSLKKAGTNNPVFMLDEIDKLGNDFRGDPASALLEVLDPEQNDTFEDHYLGLHFDLSKVLFIATANRMDTVPAALADRMEVLELPGYSEEEKGFIAEKFIIPEQIEDHGLSADHLEIAPDALSLVINAYTREAGVRNLQREIAAICRRVARDVAMGQTDKVAIDADKVLEILGQRKYFSEVAEEDAASGLATGLAWTPGGGEILFIEVRRLRGKGKLIATGSLGEVMKESAQSALSWLRARAKALGIEKVDFDKYDLHIHVPSGAMPKDGPSAGVALLCSLLSLLRQKKVDPHLAMTGEITLRGAVLPVGGIKEKMLAAKRAGIKRVIMPAKNEKDLTELTDEVKEALEFVFVETMDEVIRAAFPTSAEPPLKVPPDSQLMI